MVCVYYTKKYTVQRQKENVLKKQEKECSGEKTVHRPSDEALGRSRIKTVHRPPDEARGKTRNMKNCTGGCFFCFLNVVQHSRLGRKSKVKEKGDDASTCKYTEELGRHPVLMDSQLRYQPVMDSQNA